MGNKPLDAEKTLRVSSSSISNYQSRASLKGGFKLVSMGKKSLDVEKTLRSSFSSISNNQDAQSGRTKANPPAIQVQVLQPIRLPRPLAWHRLLIRWGDYPQVHHVVQSWNGANRVPHREGLVGNVHHQGEALDRQTPPIGKYTLAGRVKVKPDRE